MKHKKIKKLEKWNKLVLNTQMGFVKAYGLRNKRELQRIYYIISKYRKLSELDKEKSLKALIRMGILNEGHTLLDLKVKQFLDRRLQTIVSKKFDLKLKESRQKITHGKIVLNNQKLKSPGQLLNLKQEDELSYTAYTSESNSESIKASHE
jgi:small subunit ribosomal protein S4